ncbi:MFS transporter [Jidongwangia harbinensis]|uniref:MFS transporter n=1 Tax=Jidongwangia harbinensis TaxID=2878561 RepID=UPI001CD9C9B2|nr:MFS transporter [Jidongwangia harbinensis]MCA2212423.1 MFS transporter [Jidongwangia harbinensis]
MTIVGPPRATYRDVFAVPEFRTLLGGFAVFLVSETVQMLALSVLIYASTGSPLLAALAYVAGFVPQALGGTVLLAVADRWRPRRVLLGYDAARLTVAVLLASGLLPSAGMLLVVFALGGVAPVVQATRTALLPDLLSGDAYVLGRSLFSVTSAGMQVAGAAVGGVLLAVVGPAGALWLTAAACLVSAAITRFGLAAHPARTPGSTAHTPGSTAHTPGSTAHTPGSTAHTPGSTAHTPGSTAHTPSGTAHTPSGTAHTSGDTARGRRGGDAAGAVRQTWRVNRALLGDPAVRGLLLAQWLPGALMVAAEGVVVPYAAGRGGGSAAGALLASAAGGMLIGEFVVGRFVPPRLRERLTPWLALLLGVPLLVFVLRPGPVLAAVVFGTAAAGFAYHLGLARRFLEAVPEISRGQAFGLATTGTMTLQGLAMAAAGGLAEVLAPGTVMALAGAASVAATLTLWGRLRPATR